MDQFLFYELQKNQAWRYVFPARRSGWLAGGTFCYFKTLWERNQFLEIDIGEDNWFLKNAGSARIIPLPDNRFYIGLIHSGNSSPKEPGMPSWRQVGLHEIKSIMGDDWHFYSERLSEANSSNLLNEQHKSIADDKDLPLVSCIMPTCDRRQFIPRAILYFFRQNYPKKELIIIDDGSDVIRDLLPQDPRIYYLALRHKRSIGAKRNMACKVAHGEIVLIWDDDDWHGPHRITRQVTPMIQKEDLATGISANLILDLDRSHFYSISQRDRMKLYNYDFAPGTLAFWKIHWDRGAKFPNVSIAEDAALAGILQQMGVSIQKISNNALFVYVRHPHNTWHISAYQLSGLKGRKIAKSPDYFPQVDLDYYGITK